MPRGVDEDDTLRGPRLIALLIDGPRKIKGLVLTAGWLDPELEDLLTGRDLQFGVVDIRE